MKVEQQERTASRRPEPDGATPRRHDARLAAVAISLVLVAVAIGSIATLNGRTTPSQGSRAVYLDPMTGAREAGPYAQPLVGGYVDAQTASREGGPYAVISAAPMGPMTASREGGPYATSAP